MSGPITIDTTKRTTPCSLGCRHPLCVELAKKPVNDEHKAVVTSNEYKAIMPTEVDFPFIQDPKARFNEIADFYQKKASEATSLGSKQTYSIREKIFRILARNQEQVKIK